MKKGIVTLLVIAVALLLIGLSVQPTLAGSDTAAQGKMATEKAGAAMQDQKININTADMVTLSTLKGIGPVLAERIVDYRSKSGNFKSIEDLKNVQGIGDALFSKIAPMLTVE
jgi:competence protein ComEA